MLLTVLSPRECQGLVFLLRVFPRQPQAWKCLLLHNRAVGKLPLLHASQPSTSAMDLMRRTHSHRPSSSFTHTLHQEYTDKHCTPKRLNLCISPCISQPHQGSLGPGPEPDSTRCDILGTVRVEGHPCASRYPTPTSAQGHSLPPLQ